MSVDHGSPHEIIYLQYWAAEPSWCMDRIDGDLDNDEEDTVYVREDVMLKKLADAWDDGASAGFAMADGADEIFNPHEEKS